MLLIPYLIRRNIGWGHIGGPITSGNAGGEGIFGGVTQFVGDARNAGGIAFWQNRAVTASENSQRVIHDQGIVDVGDAGGDFVRTAIAATGR